MLAVSAARAATWASRATGRGAGGMIGGLIAGAIDPSLMESLGAGRPVMLVTGTNGKSTTTRMLASAMRTVTTVATNEGGDNMDAGIISALLADTSARNVVLECDELHVPQVATKLKANTLVLLNLSRDQLDRVGEINTIEQRLRSWVEANPQATIVANCDDVMITSIAFDHPQVIWVAAGASWTGDSVACPRTGGAIIHEENNWYSSKPLPDGRTFARPKPDWWLTFDSVTQAPILHGPKGDYPLALQLPGTCNLGNAAQAVAAAAANGVEPKVAVSAVGTVNDVAGRYATYDLGEHQVHLLLAKNPAGWQQALAMVDRSADALVVATNGQVADGEDLSWLWDVQFEDLDQLKVFAAGERGTDLAVRLTYAGVSHELLHDPMAAIAACPPGRVEVLANYTAFRDLKRVLGQAKGAQND